MMQYHFKNIFNRPTYLFRSPRFQAYFMLGLILFVLADLKLTYNLSQTYPNIDGGYYTDIAQHVRDGDGLKTDISLYHQGFKYFPHPTAIYPLWPWIYGMVARFSSKPILITGINLATFFFFLSLIFGYLWANRVFPEPIFPDHLPGFTAGHVFVLMLASHTEYFIFTSQPYTEGIAYALLLAGAWRFSYLFEKGGITSGIEVGLWLGLIFLSRTQLIIVAIATFPALVGACFWHPNRKGAIQMLIVSAMTFVTIAGVHYMWVKGFIQDFHLKQLSKNRDANQLSQFNVMVHTETVSSYLKNRLKGFIIAFKLEGRYAFSRSFRLLHYSLIAAVPFCYFELRRYTGKFSSTSLSDLLGNTRTTFYVFVVLLSLGGWLSIHTMHMNYFDEWFFARRQGLTCLFIFFLAMMYLLRQKKFLSVFIGVLLLSSSTIVAYIQYSSWAKKADMNAEALTRLRLSEVPPRNQKLVKFLLDERKKRNKLTVVWTAQQPQLMAPYIPGVGFHWIYDKTTFEDVRIMFEELGADYLLLNLNETRNWEFRRNNQKFHMAFDPVKDFSKVSVFVRKTLGKAERVKLSSSQNTNYIKDKLNSLAEKSHRNSN